MADSPGPPLERRGWSVLLLVWLLLVVGYPVAITLMAQEPERGLAIGIRTAVLGAILLAGVWWASGRLRWPDRLDAAFWLAHLAGGLSYGAAWWAGTIAFDAVWSGMAVRPALVRGFTGPFAAWNIFLGVLVYGLTAGLSYAVRAHDTARREQVRAARCEALASRAQLSALQAQLNPHFLFNTLHSLGVLIRRDPRLAEDAIERLGELLRYALDRGACEEVALCEEWEFVENYLALEQIRLGERLRIERRVDEAALRFQVPPFCLQPLVENAIRHGLDPLPDGGTLRIGVERGDRSLILTVRDDGVGAETGGELARSGVGLGAISSRLDSWEDGPGSLDIETSPGEGFLARVSVPLPRQDESALHAAVAPAAVRS